MDDEMISFCKRTREQDSKKFENITEVQKEIAFAEKQTKTNSYTFVSNIVNTQKSEQPKSVFDRLQAKNKW